LIIPVFKKLNEQGINLWFWQCTFLVS